MNSSPAYPRSSYSTPINNSLSTANASSRSPGSLATDVIILAIKAFKEVICKSTSQESKSYQKICFYGITENDVPYAIQFNDFHDTDDHFLQSMLTKCMDSDVCLKFITRHNLYEARVTERDMYITNFGPPFAPCEFYLRLKPRNNNKFLNRHYMPQPLLPGSEGYTTDPSQWGGITTPTDSYASDEAFAYDLFNRISKKRNQPDDSAVPATFILEPIKTEIQEINIPQKLLSTTNIKHLSNSFGKSSIVTDIDEVNVVDISDPTAEKLIKKQIKKQKQCITLYDEDDENEANKENDEPKVAKKLKKKSG